MQTVGLLTALSGRLRPRPTCIVEDRDYHPRRHLDERRQRGPIRRTRLYFRAYSKVQGDCWPADALVLVHLQLLTLTNGFGEAE